MDIQAARAEYVCGKQTYAQIAEHYGVTKSYIEKAARRDGWKKQRDAYRKSVAEKAIESTRQRGTRMLERLMAAADDVCEVLKNLSADPDQFYLYRTEEGEIRARKADTKAIKNATSALAEATKVVRNLYGIPSREQEKHERIEERKLRLMERREGAEEGSTGGVIMMPAVLSEQEDGEEVSS